MLSELRGQQPADRDDPDEAGLHLVELRLLPVPHEQGHRVAASTELEGGVDDEALGPADAESRPEERDVEESVLCHRASEKLSVRGPDRPTDLSTRVGT